jgi:hypothetical protein
MIGKYPNGALTSGLKSPAGSGKSSNGGCGVHVTGPRELRGEIRSSSKVPPVVMTAFTLAGGRT